MSIILKAGWSRKSGRPGSYGSEGTWCEIEIEIDDSDRGKLNDEIAHLQSLCKQRVDVELAKADKEYRDIQALTQEAAAERDEERRAAAAPAARPQVKEGDYDGEKIKYRDEQRRLDDRPARQAEPRREEPRRDERRDDRRDDRRRDESRGHDRQSERRERSSGGDRRKDWKRDGGRPRTGKELFGFTKDWGATRWFQGYAKDNRLPDLFAQWHEDEVSDAVDLFLDTEARESRSTNGAAY
jgi:hypothetical protein